MKILEPLPYGALADLERAIEGLARFGNQAHLVKQRARAALRAVRAQNAAVKEAGRLAQAAAQKNGELAS